LLKTEKPVFSDGGAIGEDAAKYLGTGEGAKASADFLLDFEHPNITLGLVIAQRGRSTVRYCAAAVVVTVLFHFASLCYLYAVLMT
jgi:hypothetical protein